MYEALDGLEKKFKLTEFPLNVAVEPTNACNLNCTVCANNALTRKRGFMNMLLYRKIIDEIAKENPYTRIWLDFYGEPLLSKHKLYYMIDYAKKMGCKNISMNSNATLLDQEMTEMLLDADIDFISFDCDGFSKNIYEKIRVGADRDVVYHNIEYFLKRKKERGKENVKAEVKIMEMEENKEEVEQVMDYWREKGAWTAKRRLLTWGGAVDSIKINGHHERIACGWGIGICAINWEGKVANCAVDADAKVIWGDVNTSSIKEIWQKRNEKMVTAHITHNFEALPEICQNCNDWHIIGEERFDEKGNPIQKSYAQDHELFQK